MQEPAARRTLVREWVASTSKIFLIAVAIDLIYQVVVFKAFYPIESLVIAFVLAMIPYALIRGPVNRITRRRMARTRDQSHGFGKKAA